ncbi:PREDICTED: transcription initiation factor TFIID subunit 11-like [Prunus mume]|uniref:Transcription initiation factor TFIID subunit 11-like n=1 Tax=Prunus mume TaxID=102107 RepID=A0ABM0P623_PRUMU|nr:PREDICTED: transcription initiation factor TFIID subunit 11-like [Prunus mume]
MGALSDELDFLQLRQQLKQRIRNNHMKDLGYASESSVNKNKLLSDDFGYFFGPSQSVIAQRVIEESKAFMPELRNLASKVGNSHAKGNKDLKSPVLSTTNAKSGLRCKNLKESRDYSFLLSNNAEIPSTSKGGEPRLVKNSLSNSSNKRNPVSVIHRASSTNLKSVKSQHLEEKVQSLPATRKKLEQPKKLHPPKKAKLIADSCKTALKTSQSSTKPNIKQAKHCLEPENTEVKPEQKSSSLKRSQSSTKQNIKPAKQCVEPENTKTKRHVEDSYDDDNLDISSVIKMFGPKRKHREDDDDDDGSAMVSSFADIMREERKSAKIARKEDEIERLRLEEEEKQERLRKAKQQKLREIKKN